MVVCVLCVCVVVEGVCDVCVGFRRRIGIPCFLLHSYKIKILIEEEVGLEVLVVACLGLLVHHLVVRTPHGCCSSQRRFSAMPQGGERCIQ